MQAVRAARGGAAADLTRWRIQKARRLLETSQAGVHEVAKHVGYDAEAALKGLRVSETSFVSGGGYSERFGRRTASEMRICWLCQEAILGSDLDPCQVTLETARVTRGEKAGQIFTLFCHAECLSARFRFNFFNEAEIEELGYPQN